MITSINVQRLNYRYKRANIPSLTDVSLTIPRGSIYGLLGPNGAGKTTLISLLTGVLKIQSGSINVFGFDLASDSRSVKSISAVVPQDFAFYEVLTGRENLSYFAGLHGFDRTQCAERINYCAELCGLQALLDRRAAHYSGGVKRRLNLAIGLLSNPQVLYLDEPTVGVDLQSRGLILQSIKQLSNEGLTIVYTSHYMEEIEQLCDNVAIIDGGQLIAQNAVSKLTVEDVGYAWEITLSKSNAGVPPTLFDDFDVEYIGDKIRINRLSNKQQGLRLLNYLDEQGIEVERIRFGDRDLESWYLETIGGCK